MKQILLTVFQITETEKPLERYENTEPITEPSQADDTERFTGEHKEDQTEPPKTKGGEYKSKSLIYLLYHFWSGINLWRSTVDVSSLI